MPLPKRTPPVRASPNGKRKRPFSGDDEEEVENELSDSELSDIEDEETPTAPDEDEDDEDEEDVEEEEEEEEEDSSDSDSPEEENEESYTFEGEQDVSDDDSDMKMKQPVKNIAQRAIASRGGGRRTAKRLAPIRKPIATPAKKGTRNKKQPPKSTPMIKLKIGKEKLRKFTSAWTPPPGAADTGTAAATTQNTAARTPNHTDTASSTAAATTVSGKRGVQDDSDSDEDDEDESKMDEDDEPEDELGDEDAEGETDEEMVDSEDEINNTPGIEFMSRTGTPDKSRLTNRQRTRLGDITTADLLELPSGYEKPGSNKVVTLSAQEQELKRAEMARRRKNLTDQKLEEEKIDTINRLLKKQTPKMRGRGKVAGDATPADQANAEAALEGVDLPFPPTMVRWTSNKDGIRLSIPDSWLKAPVGKIFEPQKETERMSAVRRKLIEEL